MAWLHLLGDIAMKCESTESDEYLKHWVSMGDTSVFF